jgi:hypothetical protein
LYPFIFFISRVFALKIIQLQAICQFGCKKLITDS